MATDAWGIDDGFRDARGRWRPVAAETRRALLESMGVDPAEPGAPPPSAVRVIRRGQSYRLDSSAELGLEDGTLLRVETTLPPDLPSGYHELRPLDGGPAIRLIVSPGRCPVPGELRTWGWAVQLYALRSAESWGIGDLADLRRLAGWSAGELAAGLLLVNPLDAAIPVLPQEPSPYFPSSRRYRSPLYLRIEDVPGAAQASLALAPLAAAGRALNRERRIDRAAVFRLKMEALERLWAHFRSHSAGSAESSFEHYCAREGNGLVQFATFCALAEHHGGGWSSWPAEYRRPDSQAVALFAAERAERVRFHQWLQWLLDEQLRAASAELPVMQDLPIGTDPAGADAWAWQEVLASEVTVGAPPDIFNPGGQDWGLPPFVPHKLRAAAYEPFIQTVRAGLRHAGGLRIDHVMGLFRLFWIPGQVEPGRGAYVRYPAEDLLAIVALESERAGAPVVGEDLGTVEHGVRERLAECGILSYRLLWFESQPPERYPELGLAAVTTHDLPTIAGIWTAADAAMQRQVGLEPNEEGAREMLGRLESLTGLGPGAPVSEVIVRVHQRLARAPSMFVTATLEDALGVDERPNMPGTIHEWPNWSLALPASLERLMADPLVRAVAAALAQR